MSNESSSETSTELKAFQDTVLRLRDLREEWRVWNDKMELAKRMQNPLETILEEGSYSITIDGKLAELQSIVVGHKVKLKLEVKSVTYEDASLKVSEQAPVPPPFPEDKKDLMRKLEQVLMQVYD